MPHYIVQRGVPIPKPPEKKYPLLQMAVGDSFTVPFKDRGSLQAYQMRVQKKTEMRFMARKEDNVTIRIWRVQ